MSQPSKSKLRLVFSELGFKHNKYTRRYTKCITGSEFAGSAGRGHAQFSDYAALENEAQFSNLNYQIHSYEGGWAVWLYVTARYSVKQIPWFYTIRDQDVETELLDFMEQTLNASDALVLSLIAEKYGLKSGN